jgi:hypothetical protein
LLTPVGVELDEERLSFVFPIPGEEAPPMLALAYNPRQAAPEIAELLERGDPHRLRIEGFDLAAFGHLGEVGMGAEQLALPKEPAVEMMGLPGAGRHAPAGLPLVLGDAFAGDGIDEPLVGSRGLVRLFRRQHAGLLPNGLRLLGRTERRG